MSLSSVVILQLSICYLHKENIVWMMLKNVLQLLKSLLKEKLAYNHTRQMANYLKIIHRCAWLVWKGTKWKIRASFPCPQLPFPSPSSMGVNTWLGFPEISAASSIIPTNFNNNLRQT